MAASGVHQKADVHAMMLCFAMQNPQKRQHPLPVGGIAEEEKKEKVAQMVPKSEFMSLDYVNSRFELMPEGDRNRASIITGNSVMKDEELTVRQAASTEAVLSSIQQDTVVVTKKINLVRRGIGPSVARIASHRIRHFRNHVHEIDLSHNPLGMSGLLHIMFAIHDAQHIKVINFASCSLDVARHFDELQNPSVPLPEFEAMSGDEDGLEEEDIQDPEKEDKNVVVEEKRPRRASLITPDGHELEFASLSSHRVFSASSVIPLMAGLRVSVEHYEGIQAGNENLFDEALQAALRFKEFLTSIPTLEDLNLSNNNLGLGGAFLLAKATGSPSGGMSQTLRVVNLSDCSLGMRGAGQYMGQVISTCKTLVKLDISCNGIRGAEARMLIAGIAKCSSLEEVYAAHNGFGEEGVAVLLRDALKDPHMQNLRVLDLRFNRFTGSRLGPWPDDFQKDLPFFSHVMRAFDSLLPMLQRFGPGQDPATTIGITPAAKSVNGEILKPKELDQYRLIYNDLALLLDEQLNVSYKHLSNSTTYKGGVEKRPEAITPGAIFGGTIMHLLLVLQTGISNNLTHLLLAGNLVSEEIIATIMHVASKLKRKTQISLDSLRFETVATGELRSIATAHRVQPFPKSTFSADGYQVISVKPRSIVLDCGMQILDLQHATSLDISCSLETGLSLDKTDKQPRDFLDISLYAAKDTFLPSGQMGFEREMIGRIQMRASSSVSRALPSLGTMLQTLNEQIDRARCDCKEALQRASLSSDVIQQHAAVTHNVNSSRFVRNLGRPAGAAAASKSITQMPQKTPPKTPSFSSYASLRKSLRLAQAPSCPASPEEVLSRREEALSRRDGALRRKGSRKEAARRKSKVEWNVAKDRLHLGTHHKLLPKLEAEALGAAHVADPEGSDTLYQSHETLPTFACAERLQMQGGLADLFSILHPVKADGSYQLPPRFFNGKGAPQGIQLLNSLQMRGDLLNLASACAESRDVKAFWDTVGVIRQGSASMKDSWVSTTFEAPERYVIGEPFCFHYYYEGTMDRLPDSYKVVIPSFETPSSPTMDWIGLYKVTNINDFYLARDVSERVGCSMVKAKFRPPHCLHAQVQLRHVIWEPGLYQLHMNLVNSEKVIGSSAIIKVAYAHAQLSCPSKVPRSGEPFELKYVLDYQHCNHPTTDWIGIFPKKSAAYTPQAALQRLMVPPKNIGVIHVEASDLEIDNEICYFQDFGSCDRIIGRTHVRCVQRAENTSLEQIQTPSGSTNQNQIFKKDVPASTTRNIRFYVCGTFADMQEERNLMHGEVMSKLRQFCDSRRLSVSFVDVRHGLHEGGGLLTDRVRPESDETYLDRCLTELDCCIPYFICLLGQVYGEVPNKLPSFAEEFFPALSDFRHHNRAVDVGCRMSMTEMEVLIACLLDETKCKYARFFIRDQSYTSGKDGTFKDSEEWEKHAMELLKIKIKRAVAASKELNPDKCMSMRSYHNPVGFGKLISKEVMDICNKEYPSSETPNYNELFFTQLDAEAAHQRRLQGAISLRNAPLHFQQLHDMFQFIDAELQDDVQEPRKILISGASGSGKSSTIARWIFSKVQNGLEGGIKDKKPSRLRRASSQLLNVNKLNRKSEESPLPDSTLRPAPVIKSTLAAMATEGHLLRNRLLSQGALRDLTTLLEVSRVAFSWHTNAAGKKVVIAYVHGRVHHRIRHGYDVVRSLVITLYNAFDLDIQDEQVLDDRLSQTLNHRLKDFPPQEWTIYLVVDGLDRLGNSPSVEEWLPKTKQSNVHWLISTSDPAQLKALHGRRFHDIPMPELTMEQRQDLVDVYLSRNNTPHNEEMVNSLTSSSLAGRPEYLVCAMDVLRLSSRVANAEAMTKELLLCESLEACYETVLRKWETDVTGSKLVMALLSLSETGLYEFELLQLLDCPAEFSPHAFFSVRKALQEVSYSSCGVCKIFNVKMFAVWRKKLLDKDSRERALRRMEAYFGALPTCNRKLDEYAFVLEKLNDWDAMYTYVTDITIFHLMYSDPVRKLQFLSYMRVLKKTPEHVQTSLRRNFESHFQLSKRWFCNGDAYYYELNPAIYVSQKALFSFQDIVFTVSSFFELHGHHEESIRDLEASLKAMFGISDLYQIPKCKPETCLFPIRVVKILRRLCTLYALHLNALVEHWLAPDEVGRPKRNIPDSVRGIDVSWWATPVPVGGARTLPQKLKLVFVINHALRLHYLQDPNFSNVVKEINGFEDQFGHLAQLVWNTGIQSFIDAEEVDIDNPLNYGKTHRDSATLRPLPLRVNHRHALSPGHESRRVAICSTSSTAELKAAIMSDTKANILQEKKGVHKETSLTWSNEEDGCDPAKKLPPLEFHSSTTH